MSGGQTKAQTKVERKWKHDETLLSYVFIETMRVKDDKGTRTVKRQLGYVLKDHTSRWRAYMCPYRLLGDREDAVLAQAMVEAEVRAGEKK